MQVKGFMRFLIVNINRKTIMEKIIQKMITIALILMIILGVYVIINKKKETKTVCIEEIKYYVGNRGNLTLLVDKDNKPLPCNPKTESKS